LTLDPDSCKCPGQSVGSQEFTFFLKFCVSQNIACQVVGDGSGTFEITKVTQGPGNVLVFDPDNCFPAGGTTTTPGRAGGTLGGCTTVLRFEGGNSGAFLDVTFTVNGVTFGPVEVKAPTNCTGTTATLRCAPCADNVLP